MISGKNINIVTSWCFAIAPIFAVYIILPGLSLSNVCFLLLFALLFSKHNISAEKSELNFLFKIIILSLVSFIYHTNCSWFDTSLFFNNLVSILFCFVPLSFCTRDIDVKWFLRIIIILGVISSLVVIWQRISLITTGSFVNEFFFPGLEINRPIETFSISRPSAFFTEPAHFAIFMLPIFYASLLMSNRYFPILFGFSILCSGSTTGFLLLVVVLLYHLMSIDGRHKIAKMLFALVVIILISIVIFYLYPEIILENFVKLGKTQEGADDQRLLGPIMNIPYMDSLEHFFGITLNQMFNFIKFNKIPDVDESNYANALIYMYISYGAVGFSFLIFYIWKKWKQLEFARGFIIILIGIICSDQILFNDHFLYLITFVIVFNKLQHLQMRTKI